MKLFIGNLASEASEDDLRQAGEAFGTVSEVSIALDDKGQPKGHGFVVMATKAEGQAALAGLNGKDIKGQALKVSEARPEKLRGKAQTGNKPGFADKGGHANRGPGASRATGSKGGFTAKGSSSKV